MNRGPLHMSCLLLSAAVASLFFIDKVSAHEIRPALLEIIESQPGLYEVTWKVPALGDRVLGLSPVFLSA